MIIVIVILIMGATCTTGQMAATASLLARQLLHWPPDEANPVQHTTFR
jgi:hypothetical protein